MLKAFRSLLRSEKKRSLELPRDSRRFDEIWRIRNTRSPSYHDLAALRRQAWHLYKTNGYAKRAVNVLATYMIGSGITPHAIAKNGKRSQRIDERLKFWADSTRCDFDGRQNLYGIQSLVTKHLVRDGECFVIRVHDKNREIPVCLRIIDADLLDPSKGIQGIEFSASGLRTGYHFFLSPPESTELERQSTFLPAKEVLHVFQADRAGQVRGISWLSTILDRLKTFDEYEGAQLEKQKISANFMGVFRDLEISDIAPYEEKMEQMMKPGSMLIAPAGQTVEWSSPPSVGDFKEFTEHNSLSMAAGVEVPYMLLSCDYSKTSYSSSRLELINFYKHIEALQNNLIIPSLCEPIFQWFLEALELTGVSTASIRASWARPKRDFVDPVQEIEAYERAVKSGFLSHSDVLKEMGRDPDEVYCELTYLKDLFKKHDILQPIEKGTV